MSKDGDVDQDISGNHNTQINSGNDTIAAIGKGAIAAQGDITINHGIDSINRYDSCGPSSTDYAFCLV
mgnify:CR=1 FL=1